MRRPLTLICITFSTFLVLSFGKAQAKGLLLREVAVKKAQCLNEDYAKVHQDKCEFRVIRRNADSISEGPGFGIHTPFAYHPHEAQAIWVENFKRFKHGYTLIMIFERNEFPLDNDWETIWRSPKTLRFNIPFTHQGQIHDRVYRITLMVTDDEIPVAPY